MKFRFKTDLYKLEDNTPLPHIKSMILKLSLLFLVENGDNFICTIIYIYKHFFLFQLLSTKVVKLIFSIYRVSQVAKIVVKVNSRYRLFAKRNYYNPGQNIWQKVKRYNKIGQGFKNIISNFACFLTAIVNV